MLFFTKLIFRNVTQFILKKENISDTQKNPSCSGEINKYLNSIQKLAVSGKIKQ